MILRRAALLALGSSLGLVGAAAAEDAFDVVIRGGTVYDGTGGAPRPADVGIRGDLVAAIGDLAMAKAKTAVDARGLAVAPGFINMLSWSSASLIADGRSQGEIRQGVTTQIMGEGESMGPYTLEMNPLFERLRDPEARKRIAEQMRAPDQGWENLCVLAGSPERILLVSFKNEALKPLTGKTLAEAARARGKSPEETVMDLILEDRTRIGVVFFLMSEENVRKELRLPWVSFGSDAASMAPEGVFLKSSAHPRAYGNFARLLGRYVREEKQISLAEAVHRLSGLPATNLGLDRRGFLKEGQFADVVVFDPATIADRATYDNPHQYAVGVRHVLVNGVAVLKDGEHTGTLPGRALYGPGRVKPPS